MALTKDFKIATYGQEVTIKDSYIKIGNFSGDKNELSINVFIQDEDKSDIISYVYNFIPDLTGENFIKQGYAHLKTLQGFADAVDC